MPEPVLADFDRIESAIDPGYASDGRRLAFRSNRPGSPQLFVRETDGAAPRQVTDTGGVVYGHAFRPGHDEILFVTDRGGDEQFQLSLLDLGSGAVRALTDDPDVKHVFGAWSPDGRLVAFATTARDPAAFDIHVLDVETGEARAVLERDGMQEPRAFSPDGRLLLIHRTNLDEPGDSDLEVIDLDGGGHRTLTAHDGPPAEQHTAAFAGPAVIAISDEGRDRAGVQRIDLASGAREFLLTPDWEVERLAVAPDGSRLAIVVNEDGTSRLEAYALTADARLGARLPLPALPPGVIGANPSGGEGIAWRPDGGAIALGFESPRHTPDIWEVEVGGRAPARATHGDPRSIPVDRLPEPRVIRYRSFDGREIPAFFYVPEHAGATPLPCMVLVHGGPEAQARAPLWGRYAAAHYLLATGRIAVLVPNVRGSTGYGREFSHADDRERRMDSVRDLVAALDWLAGTGAVDPARVGVMGGSYGGFMVLAAITEAPERWAAAIDLFGIADFETFLRFTAPWRRKHRAREYGDDPALLRAISPLHRADRIRTPLLVFQGDRDVRVPAEESEQIVETVRRREGVVDYVVFENEGHGFQQRDHRIEMNERIVSFLGEHLRLDG